MLSPSEQAKTLNLLLNEQASNIALGWTLIEHYPTVFLPLAREIFLAAHFANDDTLSAAIVEALANYIPSRQLSIWKQGLQLFNVHYFQVNAPDQPHHLPTLMEAYQNIATLFEPVFLKYPSLRKRYYYTAQRMHMSLRADPVWEEHFYRNILEQEPTHQKCLLNLTIVYEHLYGQPLRAVQYAQELLQHNIGYGCQIGRIYTWDLCRPDKARYYYQQARQSQQTSVIATLLLARASAYQGDCFFCAQIMAEIQKQAPNHTFIQIVQAHLEAHSGHLEQAKQNYKALTNDFALASTALGYLGRLYHLHYQQFETAVTYYKECLKLQDNRPHPSFSKFLIILLVNKLGCLEEALPYYQAWCELPPYANNGADLTPAERVAFECAAERLPPLP